MAGHSSQFRPSVRRGFSFVELLFAVAVLGIGFIMLAAIFPVGLQQTKLTLDETAAAGNARGMAAKLLQLAQAQVIYNTPALPMPPDTRSAFPDTYARDPTVAVPAAARRYVGQVRTLNDPRPLADGMGSTPPVTAAQAAYARARRYNMWRALSTDLIQPADDRLATTVLFKRDANAVPDTANPPQYKYVPSSTAQVITINAQVANQPAYAASDISDPTTTTAVPQTRSIYNLEPRPVAVQIVKDDLNGTYVATFFSVRYLDAGTSNAFVYNRGGYPNGAGPSGPWDDVLDAAVAAPAEGAYVVISDDRVIEPVPVSATNYPGSQGRLNGRIFKLGTSRPDRSDLTGGSPVGVYVSFDLAPGYTFAPDGGADGSINPTVAAPKDDIIAIGLDKNDTSGSSLCGIPYTPPAGGVGSPNGTDVVVAGAPGRHGAVALVLGKGFLPNAATPGATPTLLAGYTGPAQDIAAYTTFVPVPNP